MMGRLKSWPWFALLAAVYPVLALLAHNLGQVKPTVADRSLLVSAVGALIVMGLLRWLLRDWTRAALLTAWGTLLFFSYGPVYDSLKAITLSGETLGRHRYLVPVWLILGLALSIWILRKGQAAAKWMPVLNLVGVVAVAFPVVQLAWFQLQDPWTNRAESSAEKTLTPADLELPAGSQPPDVYYIILDSYARLDTMRHEFDFDNTPFMDDLTAMGFYVARCSQSNYAQTELSLGSSLNFGYLQDLLSPDDIAHDNRQVLWGLMRHSAVRGLLESQGYRIVGFETGYYWTELQDADVYLAPAQSLIPGLSAFETTLLRTTAAWAAIDAMPSLPGVLFPGVNNAVDVQRNRIAFDFDQLETMGRLQGPKFVFAHIVSPHRPFVFDAQGNPVEDAYTWQKEGPAIDWYSKGYTEQVGYLNQRMLTALRAILADSEVPPIIILQSDTGPEEGGSQDRMAILNAYYVQGKDIPQLYPGISPVNTFRAVFDAAFGAEVPLVGDVSYFSTYQEPFDFSIVDNKCKP